MSDSHPQCLISLGEEIGREKNAALPEFLRGAGRHPSMWGLEDVHLLARAFQIQHFMLPGDPPAFGFLYKADKNLASNLSVRDERYLALLSCLQ